MKLSSSLTVPSFTTCLPGKFNLFPGSVFLEYHVSVWPSKETFPFFLVKGGDGSLDIIFN